MRDEMLPDRRQAWRARSVSRAMAYIEINFRASLSLGDIASVACISKFHFARVFRAETGLSPMQYFRRRRVMEAKRMIAAGQSPLASIAIDLGYFDHSHFSREFRAFTGMPPRQYATVATQTNGAADAPFRRAFAQTEPLYDLQLHRYRNVGTKRFSRPK